jgi:signal transduction histidine kinase
MVLVLQTSAALTGRADKIRGLEGGADNYLAAPIEADELIANVNALLRMRQTQTELRDSEERFRQLTDNIEDVFWMFSARRTPCCCTSARPTRRSGAAARDSLDAEQRSWLDAGAPGRPRRWRRALARRWRRPAALRRGIPPCCRTAHALGARPPVPVRTPATVYRVARVTSDITQRKEMEGLLRAADSNKNEFLATLAHELRNPLSPIRNAVALLGMERRIAVERQLRAREVITRQVDHLAHLVDDLLDVARISEGKIVLRWPRSSCTR